MEPSQLAMNSVSTRQDDLPILLDAFADAGFENVEFNLTLVHEYLEDGNDIGDLHALLDARNIDCVGGFETALRCFGDDPIEDNARILENARLLAELGAPTMVVGTDGPGGDDEAVVERCAAAFETVGAAVDLTLCLEFNWSPVIRSLRSAAMVSRRAGDNVGVLFDPAHYHCTPTKLADITSETVDQIGHVHVDDMRDHPGDLSHPNDDRVLPGAGHLDLVRLLSRIERHGYDGYFSIELFDAELRSIPPADAARQMYERLIPFCDS